MRQVRIVLAEVPDELRRLVERVLASEPDLFLVGVAGSELTVLLEAEAADVAVLAMRAGRLPAVADRLLDEYPRIGVVCVDVAAGRGAVYRLRPDYLAIEEVSPRTIAAAIRGAASDNAVGGHR
jgi:DNA-binding NarL/FixJ family response regulator